MDGPHNSRGPSTGAPHFRTLHRRHQQPPSCALHLSRPGRPTLWPAPADYGSCALRVLTPPRNLGSRSGERPGMGTRVWDSTLPSSRRPRELGSAGRPGLQEGVTRGTVPAAPRAGPHPPHPHTGTPGTLAEAQVPASRGRGRRAGTQTPTAGGGASARSTPTRPPIRLGPAAAPEAARCSGSPLPSPTPRSLRHLPGPPSSAHVTRRRPAHAAGGRGRGALPGPTGPRPIPPLTPPPPPPRPGAAEARAGPGDPDGAADFYIREARPTWAAGARLGRSWVRAVHARRSSVRPVPTSALEDFPR
ncbi:hypothetical protein P7K49_012133 [Saguinus oedipus]|uniref:Uncharacterized protein n=1 Tax=Saguinus oedipus TaxID=9490 RepID=A0ABQ9VTC0_SAGOE|nr:hypothetical protein P7K49_012133 [Saguinus oedipus]